MPASPLSPPAPTRPGYDQQLAAARTRMANERTLLHLHPAGQSAQLRRVGGQRHHEADWLAAVSPPSASASGLVATGPESTADWPPLCVRYFLRASQPLAHTFWANACVKRAFPPGPAFPDCFC